MSSSVFECDVDNKHYWIISVGLGSSIASRLLDNAKLEGRCPMSLSNLADEILDTCGQWCFENCSGSYQLNPTSRLEIWFDNPSDALLFKLTHG